MNWEDEGYLLSKIKFRENANIINVFTNKYGKMSGIVYGGNSRKIRNYLQVANKIFVFHSSKSENRIGYFKTELVEAISPKFFNDKKKTTALLSLTSLLNLLLQDSQPNENLFNSLTALLNNFTNSNWIIFYILWEINLITELGFDPNLSQFEKNINAEKNFFNVEIDNLKYQIPLFLIKSENIEVINNYSIKLALSFTRNLMLNKFFLPNNLLFPKSRIILENYFN